MNVPQLRFDGFDGEWEDAILSELGEFNKSYSFSRSSEGKGQYRHLHYGDIHSKFSGILNNQDSFPSIIESGNFEVIKNGDVVFADASEDYKDLGKAVTFSNFNAENLIAGLHTHLFRPSEKLDNRFLMYFTQTPRYFTFIKRTGTGVSVLGISKKNLGNLELKLPNIKEQEKIASFLNLLDEKIKNQKEKIEKLDQFKKGMMQKVFSQELRFKNEDGGEFPEWKETTFGKVVTNKSEKHNPKSESILLPCIELENIEQGSGQLIGNINNNNQQSMKNKFGKGSVLFGKLRPYLKKYLYTNFEGLCSTEIWVLNSKDSRLTNGFIYFFIQGAEFLEAANKSIGSKMPRADWNSVSELSFKIPTKKEQEKIVDYLRALENKIVKEKEKLIVLEEQKKGFMQGMFV